MFVPCCTCLASCRNTCCIYKPLLAHFCCWAISNDLHFYRDCYCYRHLPLAKDLVRLARQQLVHRLDSYMSRKNEPVFRRVLSLVDKQVILLLHTFIEQTLIHGMYAHL